MDLLSLEFFDLKIGFVRADDTNFNFNEHKIDNLDTIIEDAHSGDVHSIFKVGTVYEYGGILQSKYGLIEIFKDVSTAIEVYKKAAAQGSSLANYRLGDIYFHGIGVESDQHTAINYFIAAAEKGEPNAMFFLATIEFQTGDQERSCAMIRSSADHGHSEAAYNTALMYYSGEYFWSRSLEQAMYYIDIALSADPENLVYKNLKLKIVSEF